MGRAAPAAVALAAAFAYGGEAAPGDPELALVGTFSSPTYLTSPPGDAERLFVVEQAGPIRVVRNGAVLPTPFLDLTSLVLSGGERGLLSIAFAPDYATTGRFYVYYTARNPVGELTIAEYRRSSNPDVAETSGRSVLTIPHSSFANHNGGQLQFGPEAYLYIGRRSRSKRPEPRHAAGQDPADRPGGRAVHDSIRQPVHRRPRSARRNLVIRPAKSMAVLFRPANRGSRGR